MFSIYYTLAVPHTMLNRIACQFYLIITREDLNEYIIDWEHIELLSDDLWKELCAAGL